MSSKKREIVYLHGKVYWAKVLGAPRTNYNEDGREWSFEFEPDAEGVVTLTEHGLEDRLRDRSDKKGYEDRGKFIILRRNELDYEGNPNEHIRIVDAADQKWDENKLLGNATEVDVKVQIVDYGRGKKKGIYPVAIRVLELVPYESTDFEALPDDDPRVAKAKSAKRNTTRADDFEKDFGLDEDEPEVPDVNDEQNHPDLDDDMPAE